MVFYTGFGTTLGGWASPVRYAGWASPVRTYAAGPFGYTGAYFGGAYGAPLAATYAAPLAATATWW